jgi:hypothetical protein
MRSYLTRATRSPATTVLVRMISSPWESPDAT